jgi:hypothetical protein
MCINSSTWAKIHLSFGCRGEGISPDWAGFIAGERKSMKVLSGKTKREHEYGAGDLGNE